MAELPTRSQDRAIVLIPQGHVGLIEALMLQELITERLADGCNRIVIDLRAVDHADPALLLPLLRGRRRAARKGGRLVVVADRADLEAMLARVGLDAVLSTTRSFDAALENGPYETIEV